MIKKLNDKLLDVDLEGWALLLVFAAFCCGILILIATIRWGVW
jgi:hypothetical protein